MAAMAEIIVSVRARVEQFKQAMKDATNSISANNQQIEKRASEAGNSFTRGFAKVTSKMTGFNFSKIALDGLTDASAALASGGGLRQAVEGFTKSVQDSLFKIPIAGQIAQITDNIINASAKATERAIAYTAEVLDKVTGRIDKMVQGHFERLKGMQDIAKTIEEDLAATTPEQKRALKVRREQEAATADPVRAAEEAVKAAKAQLNVAKMRKPEEVGFIDRAIGVSTFGLYGANAIQERNEELAKQIASYESELTIAEEALKKTREQAAITNEAIARKNAAAAQATETIGDTSIAETTGMMEAITKPQSEKDHFVESSSMAEWRTNILDKVIEINSALPGITRDISAIRNRIPEGAA
jgi:hypothetical protein